MTSDRRPRMTAEDVRRHYARMGLAVPDEVERELDRESGKVAKLDDHRGKHWAAGIQRGRREDLGNIYFRSRCEANWGRWLNYQGIRWEYEPKTFDFLPFKQYRANTSYTPDFYLLDTDEYHEVKGWMTPDSKTKLARMRLWYPGVRVRLVMWDEVAEVEKKLGRVIPGWELGEERRRTG
jgi:hypothetical protein